MLIVPSLVSRFALVFLCFAEHGWSAVHVWTRAPHMARCAQQQRGADHAQDDVSLHEVPRCSLITVCMLGNNRDFEALHLVSAARRGACRQSK